MKPPVLTVLTQNSYGWIDTADVAKVIRYRLKLLYPETKFSVRISRYSGGSSITIEWTDGPTTKAVKAITDGYDSKRFDGSIDFGYSVSSWLLPDMSAVPAHSPGSSGQGGYDAPFDNPKPHPDAVLVHFGSGYISHTRHLSERILRAAQERSGAAGTVIVYPDGTAYFHGDTYDDDKRLWYARNEMEEEA